VHQRLSLDKVHGVSVVAREFVASLGNNYGCFFKKLQSPLLVIDQLVVDCISWCKDMRVS